MELERNSCRHNGFSKILKQTTMFHETKQRIKSGYLLLSESERPLISIILIILSNMRSGCTLMDDGS